MRWHWGVECASTHFFWGDIFCAISYVFFRWWCIFWVFWVKLGWCEREGAAGVSTKGARFVGRILFALTKGEKKGWPVWSGDGGVCSQFIGPKDRSIYWVRCRVNLLGSGQFIEVGFLHRGSIYWGSEGCGVWVVNLLIGISGDFYWGWLVNLLTRTNSQFTGRNN